MTYKLQIAGVLVVSLLAACSSIEDRELASGSFEYTQEQPGQVIDIPKGVDSPIFSDAYKLPELGEEAPQSSLGEKISVLSPSLVLPVVAGSHIEEGSKHAKVWFDQVDDNEPLDSTIWNHLIGFLDKQGIGVQTFDKEKQRLISDWIVYEESAEDSWYTISSSERTVSQRFEFVLDKKSHGRTAALSAKLIDYKEKLTADGEEITQAKDERRNEVDILNQVVAHYEFKTQVAGVKRFRQIRQGLDSELGFDADGEPAFVINADYDIAWPRLLLVLKKLGFDVKDYDKSSGLLFVKYGGGEESWWSSLWSDDEGELNLDKDEYRVKVLEVGEKTSVTLLDNESVPFPINKLTDLYPPFSKSMSDDQLDI